MKEKQIKNICQILDNTQLLNESEIILPFLIHMRVKVYIIIYK